MPLKFPNPRCRLARPWPWRAGSTRRSVAGANQEPQIQWVVTEHDNLPKKTEDHHAGVDPLCCRQVGWYGVNHRHSDDQPHNGVGHITATTSAAASPPRLPVAAQPAIAVWARWGLRPRQSDRTSHDGAQHVALGFINNLGHCGIISFAAQYPTPHDRCVRFAAVVTGDHATLATALPPPVFHRLDRASFVWRTDNRFYRLVPLRRPTRMAD
jgi:hypothetical protein